ncbi:MAG: diacylglycerol kinase [Cellvibrionales bacterium]|nr:diacylglycerol kinase [Cellvibrionales bacterium]|tara:strand:+ start:208 stop:579 length:372 start_codon:yes stop_codon:yes gene_type:complete
MDKRQQRFSIKARIKSVKTAINGIMIVAKEEHNAWLHIIATLLIIVIASRLNITAIEGSLLIFAIGLVWTCEAFNSAIEALADEVSGEYSAGIKKTKDIAAGAVLISSLTALAIGLLIVLPKF